MAVAWITGARGFVGRHLALHLAGRGDAVLGIGHGIWPSLEASAWGLRYWVNGEIDAPNLESLRREAGEPDLVYHLAGGSSVGASIANPLEDFSRTVSSTARLLDWIRGAAPAAKVIAVSSAAVYGSGYRGTIPTGSPAHPFSPYGHHKLMMEQLCRSYVESFGSRCTVIRLFSVYGPWLRKQLLWDLCSRLDADESPIRLGGTGDELRDWTEVSDVARLLALAASLPGDASEVLDAGTGIATSVVDIATHVVRAWGRQTPITFTGTGRPGDPFSLVADDARLRQLGFRWEVPVAQGIERYVRWFRKERV